MLRGDIVNSVPYKFCSWSWWVAQKSWTHKKKIATGVAVTGVGLTALSCSSSYASVLAQSVVLTASYYAWVNRKEIKNSGIPYYAKKYSRVVGLLFAPAAFKAASIFFSPLFFVNRCCRAMHPAIWGLMIGTGAVLNSLLWLYNKPNLISFMKGSLQFFGSIQYLRINQTIKQKIEIIRKNYFLRAVAVSALLGAAASLSRDAIFTAPLKGAIWGAAVAYLMVCKTKNIPWALTGVMSSWMIAKATSGLATNFDIVLQSITLASSVWVLRSLFREEQNPAQLQAKAERKQTRAQILSWIESIQSDINSTGQNNFANEVMNRGREYLRQNFNRDERTINRMNPQHLAIYGLISHIQDRAILDARDVTALPKIIHEVLVKYNRSRQFFPTIDFNQASLNPRSATQQQSNNPSQTNSFWDMIFG